LCDIVFGAVQNRPEKGVTVVEFVASNVKVENHQTEYTPRSYLRFNPETTV